MFKNPFVAAKILAVSQLAHIAAFFRGEVASYEKPKPVLPATGFRARRKPKVRLKSPYHGYPGAKLARMAHERRCAMGQPR